MTELTVKVKDFVWDTGPAVPVIVMEYVPAGVDVEGDNVNVVLQIGVQDGGEKEYVAPEGRPDAVNETGWIGPDTPAAVTVKSVDCPWVTIGAPLTDIEKLKGISLPTVTATAAEVVRFPAASLATAVSMWEPFRRVVVSRDTEYGAVATSVPMFFPSTLNCTPTTPTSSEAFAEMVTDPESVEPGTGEEIDTDGGVLSG